MADTFDPNLAGLSIDLQLNTAQANLAVRDFVGYVGVMETQISQAIQKAFGSVADVALLATIQLQNVSLGTEAISDYTVQIHSNYMDVNQQASMLSDTSGLQSKELQKQFELGEKILDLEERMRTIQVQESEFIADFSRDLLKITETIGLKNEGHTKQHDLLRKEEATFGNILQNVMQLTQGQREWLKVLVAGVAVAQQLLQRLAEVNQSAEMFVNTNYRAYGSQQGLVDQARVLSARYSVLEKDALDAYKVLMDLKVPRHELELLTGRVAQLQRVTGVSSSAWAQYAQRLRQAGQNATQLAPQLSILAERMRQYELSAQDVNKILMDTTVSALDLQLAFANNDPEALKKFNDVRAAMGGLAKDLGHDADAIGNALAQMVKDPIQAQMLGNQVGVAIKSTEDIALAVAKFGAGLEEQRLQMVRNGATGQQMALWLQVQRDIFFKGDEAVMRYTMSLGKQQRALGLQINTYADLERMINQTHDATDAFQQSLNTLKMQYDLIAGSLLTIKGAMYSAFGEAMLPILKGITHGVQWLAEQITWLVKELNELSKTNDLVYGLMVAAGAVVFLGSMIVGLIGILPGFAIPMLGLYLLLKRFPNAMNSIGEGIKYLATHMGTAISSILSGLGTGLQNLGTSIKNVMVPLLVLSGTIFITAAAAYVFAQAVKVISESGNNAITIMFSLAAAIGLIGVAMFTMGKFAEASSPGLVMMIGVMLSAGAAAYMMGAGLEMAGEGMLMLAAAQKQLEAGQVTLFALEMLGAATMLLIATPMLLGASVGMVLAAGGLWLAGKALRGAAGVFVDPAQRIGVASVALSVGIRSLKSAVAEFRGVGTELRTGARDMRSAAAELEPLENSLTAGTRGLQQAGTDLHAALPAMQAAASDLSLTGAVLQTAGTALADGSQRMLLGVMLAERAAARIGPLAQTLLVTAPQLIAGVVALLPAASTIYQAGMLFVAGGTALLVGAMALRTAVQYLIAAATDLQAANLQIGAGAAALLAIGTLLGSARFSLMSGLNGMWSISERLILLGSQLLYAGVKLNIGATILYLAVLPLFRATQFLVRSAENLRKMTLDFQDAVLAIRGAAESMPEAIAQLVATLRQTSALRDAADAAADDVAAAAAALQRGAPELREGAVQLVADLTAAAVTLRGAPELWEGAVQLVADLTVVAAAMRGMPELREGALELAADLTAAAVTLRGAPELREGAVQLVADLTVVAAAMRGMPELREGALELAADLTVVAAAMRGMPELREGAAQLVADLAAVAVALRSAPELHVEVERLITDIQALATAMQTLPELRFGGLATDLDQAAVAIRRGIPGLRDATSVALDGIDAWALQIMAGVVQLRGTIAELHATAERAAQAWDPLLVGISTWDASSITLELAAGRVENALSAISRAARDFAADGLGLDDDMQQMVATLEFGAAQLEATARRMETAIHERAAIAVRGVEHEASGGIRPDTIQTVQVLVHREGSDNVDKHAVAIREQNAVFTRIADGLQELIGIADKRTDVAAIVGLLRQHLPEIVDARSAFSTDFVRKWT